MRKEVPNIEKDPARIMAQYEMTLRRIHEHPFVTDATLEKREEARRLLDYLEKQMRRANIVLELFFVAAGSVGVGMAETHSDLDGIVYYDIKDRIKNERNVKGMVSRLLGYYKQEFDNKLDDVNFVNMECFIMLKEYFMKGRDKMILRPFNFFHEKNIQALIFAPEVDEFRDKKKKERMDYFRRQLLIKLKKTYGNMAKEVWVFLQNEFKGKFVDYRFEDERKDKRSRVDNVLDRKIDELPDEVKDPDKFKERIYNWIDQIKLPDFEDMCLAFGVE